MKKPFFLITQVVKLTIITVAVDAMFLMLKMVVIDWYKLGQASWRLAKIAMIAS